MDEQPSAKVGKSTAETRLVKAYRSCDPKSRRLVLAVVEDWARRQTAKAPARR